MSKISPFFSGILNLIRAIAAAIVAVGHLRGGFFTDYHSLQHSSQNIINFVVFFVTRLGIEAVIIFFVISGFLVGGNTLIQVSEKKFKFSEYLIKRISRIYIVLIPSLLIGGLLDIIRINWTTNQNFSDNLTPFIFFGNILFLQVITVPPFGSNLPLWFLTCQFWFYVLFPLLIFFLVQKFSLSKRLLSVILSILIVALTYPEILKFFPIFVLGSFLRLVPEKSVKPYINIFSAIILILLFSVTVGLSAIYRCIVWYYLLAISFSALIVLLSRFRFPDSLKKQADKLKILKIGAFFASFSFTLYTVHYPLQMFIIDFLRDRFNVNFPFHEANAINWFYFVILNICVYIFCYVIYLVTEKHTFIVINYILTVYGRLQKRLK